MVCSDVLNLSRKTTSTKAAGRSASYHTVFDKSVRPKTKLKSVPATAAGWFSIQLRHRFLFRRSRVDLTLSARSLVQLSILASFLLSRHLLCSPK
jgi:hypothetical protein